MGSDLKVGIGAWLNSSSPTVAAITEQAAKAEALGFQRCLVPRVDIDRWSGPRPDVPLDGIENVSAALDVLTHIEG